MLEQSWLSVGEETEQGRLFICLHTAYQTTEAELRALLDASPWSRWKPRPEGIQQSLARLQFLLEHHEPPGVLDRFWIASRLDAELKIRIDKDKMTAYAQIRCDWGGEPITQARLHGAMQAAGVTTGLSPQLEQQALLAARQAPPGHELLLPIAEGRPPRHGSDGFLEPLVETLAERVLRPRELDNGRVDLRDLGTLATVQADTPLLRRHPATAGEPGVDVHGHVIPAKPGKEVTMTAGEGTVLADDTTLLLAQRAGMPRHQPGGMAVDDLLTLKNVDAKHGHVEFNGSLVISGDVQPGMRVQAGGDIVIGGFVEAASVRAGGNLTIKHGAIGHHNRQGEPFNCCLTAGGNLTLAFAQYASLEAELDVHIHNQISHCYCRAGYHLLVGDPALHKGTLLGGLNIAGESIQAAIIGAQAANQTTLQVLGGVFALRSQEQELLCEKEAAHLWFDKVHEVLLKLLQLPRERRDPALLQRLKLQREQHMSTLTRLESEVERCREEQQMALSRMKVVAAQHLYAGVEVELGPLSCRVDSEHGPVQIRVQEGKAVVLPWSAPRTAR
ncbi:DUF342 domain-containing protein [Aeromonas simiae]|uniref:DUF342 domain-containing protein n=1 Tax=Aeromonas simiae TaxID=218936 RepID=A0A5J6X1H2_9GAMM|nr:FapA family protein [Aeromonas simiae]QFI56098.1 DUF342 domain-containing protein [Aeromonas simiae]